MFHFVANLKPYTAPLDAPERWFDAYLLSVDHARGLVPLARECTRRGRVLVADNGNVDHIRNLLLRFAGSSKQLDAERAAEETSGHGDTRPRKPSAALRRRYGELAASIRASSKEAITTDHVRSVVAQQHALGPRYAIGMEDFTLATLTGLGVEPELLALEERFLEAVVERAVRFAVDTAAGRYGEISAPVFAGLHAYDHDSARMAGRLAGRAGVAGIATGLVGALQDRGHARHLVEHERVVELERPVPRPYVRVAQIAAGLHTGYFEVTGARPRFHALGAGTPILVALIACLGDRETYTATDSTAPIVDGWSGPTTSLYVDDPAPLKYKATRLVQHWLGDDRPWRCDCPPCSTFVARYPFQIEEAKRWWRSRGQPEITGSFLRAHHPMSRWFPLFSNPSDLGVRLAAAMARVGHNHWILRRLERAARDHSSSPAALRAWGDEIAAAYLASHAAPAWKRATSVAWSILRAASERLEGARPTPLGDPSWS